MTAPGRFGLREGVLSPGTRRLLSAAGRIARRFWDQRWDIPLLLAVLLPFLIVATLAAKAVAVVLVYGDQGLLGGLRLFAKALPRDLLFLSAVATLALLPRRLTLSPGLRPLVFLLVYALFVAS